MRRVLASLACLAFAGCTPQSTVRRATEWIPSLAPLDTVRPALHRRRCDEVADVGDEALVVLRGACVIAGVELPRRTIVWITGGELRWIRAREPIAVGGHSCSPQSDVALVHGRLAYCHLAATTQIGGFAVAPGPTHFDDAGRPIDFVAGRDTRIDALQLRAGTRIYWEGPHLHGTLAEAQRIGSIDAPAGPRIRRGPEGTHLEFPCAYPLRFEDGQTRTAKAEAIDLDANGSVAAFRWGDALFVHADDGSFRIHPRRVPSSDRPGPRPAPPPPCEGTDTPRIPSSKLDRRELGVELRLAIGG